MLTKEIAITPQEFVDDLTNIFNAMGNSVQEDALNEVAYKSLSYLFYIGNEALKKERKDTDQRIKELDFLLQSMEVTNG